MSDFGPNKYYATNHYGNQANFSAIIDEKNAAHVETAKQYAQQNPVGKVVGDFSGKENPLNPLIALLLGIPTVFLTGKFNERLAKGASVEDSFINRAMAGLNRFAKHKYVKPVDDFFRGIGRRFSNIGIIKHFTDNKEKAQPVSGFAKQACRPLQGEFISEMVNETRALYRNRGEKPFTDLFKNAVKEGVEQGDGFLKRGLNYLGFLSGKKSDGYKDAAQKAIEQVERRFGPAFNADGTVNTAHLKNLEQLSDTHQGAYKRALEKYQAALNSDNKNKIARASRGLFKKAIKIMGEYESRDVRLLAERFKQLAIARGSREKVYKETIEHLAKFAGYSEQDITTIRSHLANKGVEEADGILSRILNRLKKKGFNVDRIKTLSNRTQILMNQNPGSFLSSGLKNLYTMSSRTFRASDFIAMYFIGDVIRKTVQAKEGERFSTFMEGMFGEVIPYWTMMTMLTRMPYNAVEGLQTLGRESGFIPRMLSKPFNWAGNLLGMGLKGGFHYKLGLAPFAEKPNDNALKNIFHKNTDLNKFKELQARILAGEGGPKGFISRLASGDFKFWRNGSTKWWKFWKMGESQTWREMKLFMRDNIPFFRRMKLKFKSFMGGGIKLGAVAALMPIVGGILTKVSHSIFGKPSTTIAEEEAEKAREQAENNPAPQQIPSVESTGPRSPLVNKFVQRARGVDSSVHRVTSSPSMIDQYLNKSRVPARQAPVNTAVVKPSMVNDYLDRIRSNPYDRNNQNIPGSQLRNDNLPARSLNTPQQDYSSVPAPITTDPETAARVKQAVEDTDKVLSSTEKFLANL